MEDGKKKLQTLRERAEEIARGQVGLQADPTLTYDDMQRALHELQVHHIELEMQNDQLRTTQLALDAERARYFDLYDLAPIGYCTVSQTGLILQANLKAATLLGKARGALVHQPLSHYFAKTSQDTYYLCRKRVEETAQAQQCELQLARSGTDLQWISLAISPAPEGAGSAELRMTLTDQTDRHVMLTAIQTKNLELEVARAEADKANHAKSDFLSRMTHELRTPLHAILGFAQLIESSASAMPDLQKRNVAQIIKAGWYLLALINEVLEVAEIDSGQLPLSTECVWLDDVLKDVATMMAPLASARNVTMTFPPDVPPHYLTADRQRVKQILINLLGNAIKYNREGGAIKVTLEELPSNRLLIAISDTGAGLSAERLSQLFQPFNRLGWQNSSEKGSGIGLVVCKRLVDLMGGRIGAQSTPGEGSVFWFELDMPPRPVHGLPAC